MRGYSVSEQVYSPKHYTAHPSGVECITITEHFSFNIGNAIKYLWRCGLKGDEIEDLKKARWYIDRELARRERHPPFKYTKEVRAATIADVEATMRWLADGALDP